MQNDYPEDFPEAKTLVEITTKKKMNFIDNEIVACVQKLKNDLYCQVDGGKNWLFFDFEVQSIKSVSDINLLDRDVNKYDKQCQKLSTYFLGSVVEFLSNKGYQVEKPSLTFHFVGDNLSHLLTCSIKWN
jgi:hypothetical protein